MLLDCGASFGENYGPIVVAPKSMRPQELAGKRIGVPGLRTTAYLTLKLFEPNFEAVVMPFDKILDAVQSGKRGCRAADSRGAAVVSATGAACVLDLGVWWHDRTKLPLPLGGNAVTPRIGSGAGAAGREDDS